MPRRPRARSDAESARLRGAARGLATTPAQRAAAKAWARGRADASASDVVAIVDALLPAGPRERHFAFELLDAHPATRGKLSRRDLLRWADGLDSCDAVDHYATVLAGPAWREGTLSDADVAAWSESDDPWHRRTAIVCTVALNVRARGASSASGDARRTLAVLRRHREDRTDTVVKAFSWALRALAKADSAAVRAFLAEESGTLAARVVRETRRVLDSGRKSPTAKGRARSADAESDSMRMPAISAQERRPPSARSRARLIAPSVVLAACAFGPCFGQTPFIDPYPPNPIPFISVYEIADIDGDGRKDLLGASQAAINNGFGTAFAATPSLTPSLGSGARIFRDLNGDGLDDCAFASGILNFQPGTPSSYVLAQSFAPLSGPGWTWGLDGGVDLGDVDGDGDLDHVGGSQSSIPGVGWSSGYARLALNTGGGVFTAAPAALPAGTLAGGQVFLRDFDADGDLDLLTVNGFGQFPAPPALLLNNGTGTFSPTPLPFPFSLDATDVACGDFDGDGFQDIAGVCLTAAGATFAVALGSSAGFATATTSAVPPPTGALALVLAIDVDSDGSEELVCADAAGLSAFDVLPGGSLTALWTKPGLTPFPYVLLAAQGTGDEMTPDLDGDGDRDLIVYGAGGVTRPAFNDGAGDFLIAWQVNPPFTSFITGNLDYRDIDGDGDDDAYSFVDPSGFGPPAFSVWWHDGSGGFTPGPTTTGLPQADYVGIDYDVDGDLDFYGLGAPGVGYDRLLMNVGGGAFTLSTFPWTSGGATATAVADVDLDGDPDIVYGRRPSTGFGSTKLLRNVSGAFVAPTTIVNGTAVVDCAVGDFDADGLPDLLEINAPNGATQAAVVRLSIGTTPVAVPQSFSGAAYAVVEDLDLDGASDAVVGSVVYLSAGGVLAPVGALSHALQWPTVFEDVDGDGARDLVQRDGAVFRRTGTTTFAPRIGPPGGGAFAATAVKPRPRFADVDGDGDRDLLTDGPWWRLNATRQLRSTVPVRIGYPASLDVFGSPGSTALLFASPNVADFFVAPGLRVLIDPVSAQFVAAVPLGSVGSSTAGFASPQFAVPNAPALVGLALHWQAVELTQGRLTNRLTTTFLSF